MAPEGSEERAKARAILLRSCEMALEDGMSASEWRALVSEHMASTVADAGADDMNAIIRFALCRRKKRGRRW
ncbi:MAG TPA: hypothetical protein VIY27_06040 [Myxococcota bacterium]